MFARPATSCMTSLEKADSASHESQLVFAICQPTTAACVILHVATMLSSVAPAMANACSCSGRPAADASQPRGGHSRGFAKPPALQQSFVTPFIWREAALCCDARRFAPNAVCCASAAGALPELDCFVGFIMKCSLFPRFICVLFLQQLQKQSSGSRQTWRQRLQTSALRPCQHCRHRSQGRCGMPSIGRCYESASPACWPAT